MKRPRNRFDTVSQVSYITAAVSAVVILWALLLRGSDVFFALRLTFGSAFLLLGLLCGWLFKRYYADNFAGQLDLSNALASWRLSESEQTAFADSIYERERGSGAAAVIVSAVLFGILLIMKLFIPAFGWGYAGLCALGLLAVIIVVAFINPRLKYRRMKSGPPDVTIGNGVALSLGSYVIWPS